MQHLGAHPLGVLVNLFQRQDGHLQRALAVIRRQIESRSGATRVAEENLGDAPGPIARPRWMSSTGFTAPLKRTREDGWTAAGDEEFDGFEDRRLATIVLADQEVHPGQVGQLVRLEPAYPRISIVCSIPLLVPRRPNARHVMANHPQRHRLCPAGGAGPGLSSMHYRRRLDARNRAPEVADWVTRSQSVRAGAVSGDPSRTDLPPIHERHCGQPVGPGRHATLTRAARSAAHSAIAGRLHLHDGSVGFGQNRVLRDNDVGWSVPIGRFVSAQRNRMGRRSGRGSVRETRPDAVGAAHASPL